MNEALIDISVLIVFFTRYELLKIIFEQVREARPARLFLFQDGPRKDHPSDIDDIGKCRTVVDDIDWECEVFRNYSDVNLGADEAGYRADKWVFSITDKCVIFEDDVIPSKTFIPFCKKMLDKYERDSRVMLISGFNPTEKTKGVSYDVFFTSATFLSGGWATWKRVVDQWDEKYEWLDDPSKVSKIQSYADEHCVMKNIVNICREHRKKGYPHFETVLISNQYLRGGYSLTPAVNMVSNIGIVEGSTHCRADISLIPKGYRRVFTMGRYDLDPENIVCPDDVTDYRPYREETYRIYGWGHPFVKFWRFLEGSFYEIRAGNFGFVWKDFCDKVRNVVYRLNT